MVNLHKVAYARIGAYLLQDKRSGVWLAQTSAAGNDERLRVVRVDATASIADAVDKLQNRNPEEADLAELKAYMAEVKAKNGGSSSRYREPQDQDSVVIGRIDLLPAQADIRDRMQGGYGGLFGARDRLQLRQVRPDPNKTLELVGDMLPDR